MKLGLLIVPAIAAALNAQEPGGLGGPGGGFSFIRMHPVLSALDSNEDGIISAKELKNAPKVLAKLDKDKDGQLTREELRPAFGGGRGFGGPGGPGGEGRRGGPGGREGGAGGPQAGGADEMVKTIMAFDKNGDGKISKDELPERMQGMFDRADADKDGFLSKDEITKMAAARMLSGPQGDPEGGREGRGPGGPGGPGGRPDIVFAALDTNNDGVISADEIKASAESLAKLDKNGDGKITEDEVRPRMPMGRGGPRGEGPSQDR